MTADDKRESNVTNISGKLGLRNFRHFRPWEHGRECSLECREVCVDTHESCLEDGQIRLEGLEVYVDSREGCVEGSEACLEVRDGFVEGPSASHGGIKAMKPGRGLGGGPPRQTWVSWATEGVLGGSSVGESPFLRTTEERGLLPLLIRGLLGGTWGQSGTRSWS